MSASRRPTAVFAWFGRYRRAGGLAGLAMAAMFGVAHAQHPGLEPLTYTDEQATRGKGLYDQTCAACHGANLEGSGPAVALQGWAFQGRWTGKSADQIFTTIRRMPPGRPADAPASDAAALLAYVLKANGAPAGPRPVPEEAGRLSALTMPFGGAAPAPKTVSILGPPAGPSRLDGLRPVTAAELQNPSPDDWLIWRRTYDSFGFSPLSQINRSNVAGLRTAWSWSLPPGGNMMTPIVRDGVLYAYSFGDIVEALDATNGELLWRFQRPLDGQATAQGKKGVALAGAHVIVPTSDLHVVALDAKTGAVAWDHKIEVGQETHFQIKSSPLVTKTKVIIGVNGFAEVKGGNFIVALDLATGKEAWRFYTVARPGEPGGESWNGLPLEQRSGGSVWVAGSYDPQSNLAFFGAAPTYNSMPLRKRSTAPGITNDALYTDATLALDADTGKLKWFFQHQKNDQLDHDWVYERQILDMRVDGRPRRVVVTGGKQAIFEALDAQTGAYLFSMDLDMQNVITAIDPKTGEKTINPAAIPRPDEALRRISLPNICPDLLGARNLMSTSYDPRTRLLIVPLTDTCMNPFPNGARWQKHPELGSDGLFGVLKAVDLQGRKVVWTSRVKGPFVSGALATGGDLVFAGTVDRYFRAFDSRNGKELWRARLDNAPASYPVTYQVDGRQYLAVATNEGFVHVEAMAAVAKERRPLAPSATLWVFELPARP